MQVEPHRLFTLIEAGPYIINATYLILCEKRGKPDPSSDVEITLVPGFKINLVGDVARLWVKRLARIVPPDPEEGQPAKVPTVRTRRAKPKG